MRALVWLRADLRINDNQALFNASRECRDGVLAVHFVTPAPQAGELNLRQQQAQNTQLAALQTALTAHNIALQVIPIASLADVPAQIQALMQTHDIDALYFNRQCHATYRQIDRSLSQTLQAINKQVKRFTDHLVAAPEKVMTPKDKPFTSLAAFKKAWQNFLRHADIHSVGALEKQPQMLGKPSTLPTKSAQTPLTSPWPMQEDAAQSLLKQESMEAWDDFNTEQYNAHTEHAHGLYTYLSNGLLSPRQFIEMLLQGNHLSNKHEVDKWLNHLIAREFDQHIMYHFPHVCEGHSFKPGMDALAWQSDENLLKAWQQGQTGFPLIDASMRCLQQTGYLPEHLLKASALFFCKVLFMDWRLGEQVFAKLRIDYEFASNNALWQWSASTGAESVIYSRIPQPVRQSQAFDANGDFIRQYCPELADFDANSIHEPYQHAPEQAKLAGYPQPIVDYASMRKQVIYHFKALNKTLKPVKVETTLLTGSDQTA